MRRQERRQREAGKKADEVNSKTHIPDDSENNLSDSVAKPKEAEIVCEAEVEMPAVMQVEHFADYSNNTERGLAQHTRMKHRIPQVDGNIDSNREEPKENEITPMELDVN